MRRFLVASVAAAGLLAGCSPTQQATTNTLVAKVQADIATGVSDYQIAKGLALVAEMASPALKGQLDPVIVKADGAVASLEAASKAATVDVPTVETLLGTLADQAQAIRLAGAPLITATPNAA